MGNRGSNHLFILRDRLRGARIVLIEYRDHYIINVVFGSGRCEPFLVSREDMRRLREWLPV